MGPDVFYNLVNYCFSQQDSGDQEHTSPGGTISIIVSEKLGMDCKRSVPLIEMSIGAKTLLLLLSSVSPLLSDCLATSFPVWVIAIARRIKLRFDIFSILIQIRLYSSVLKTAISQELSWITWKRLFVAVTFCFPVICQIKMYCSRSFELYCIPRL